MSHYAKLSIDQIIEIHDRANAGEHPAVLAAKFGCHRKTVQTYARTPIAVLAARKAAALAPSLVKKDLRGVSSKAAGEKREKQGTEKAVPVKANPKVRRGSLTVTREGSYLQMNSAGEIVKVLCCPVYRPNWTCIRRDDIDVVGAAGSNYRGRLTLRSGDEVYGTLSFTKKGREIARVEFHPDQEK